MNVNDPKHPLMNIKIYIYIFCPPNIFQYFSSSSSIFLLCKKMFVGEDRLRHLSEGAKRGRGVWGSRGGRGVFSSEKSTLHRRGIEIIFWSTKFLDEILFLLIFRQVFAKSTNFEQGLVSSKKIWIEYFVLTSETTHTLLEMACFSWIDTKLRGIILTKLDSPSTGALIPNPSTRYQNTSPAFQDQTLGTYNLTR